MKKGLVFGLTLILFSCGVSSTKNSEKLPLFEVLTQQSDGGANIRFFEILTEPNEVKMLENDANLKNKIKSTDIEHSNFVVLNMGEKPSDGYQIGIESVTETEKNIIVTIKETVPKIGNVNTQSFTNPFCVVKINSKKEIVIK